MLSVILSGPIVTLGRGEICHSMGAILSLESKHGDPLDALAVTILILCHLAF